MLKLNLFTEYNGIQNNGNRFFVATKTVILKIRERVWQINMRESLFPKT